MPIINPYKRPVAAAATALPQRQQEKDVSQSTMGLQSQRRLSLKERTHQMQASSHRKKPKVGQQTLFGTVAFDPLKDCPLCKAKQFGRSVHRAHHERCINNRKTRGMSVSTLLLRQEEKRPEMHFNAPLAEEEKCSGKYTTPEAVQAFFTTREKSSTTTTTTLTSTQILSITTTTMGENDVTAADMCHTVTNILKDVAFVEEHKSSTAPLPMLAFAKAVVKVVLLSKGVNVHSHFNGLTVTVPATNEPTSPEYHSIIGQKLLLVNWIRMYGLDDIQCS